jgi:hypothetical protein
MKKSKEALFKVFLVVSILCLGIIACGTNNNVVVNPPEEREEMSEGESEDIQPEVEETEEISESSVEPEVEETKEVGTARSNPAPVGSEIIADKMAFVVLDSIRPADDIIMDGNQFNTEPESGQEYILVQLQVTCMKSSDDQCNLTPFMNFSIIGSSGIAHDPEIMVAGVEGLLESTEFYGEGVLTGYLPFIVGQDETDLILVYEPLLIGDTFYLSIPSD